LNAYEVLEPIEHCFKKKVCLIGNLENYKNEFQQLISSNSLPINNKDNIGVNISRVDYILESDEKHERFEFLLWNVDCRQRRSFLRTIFYNGTEAMIVFISDTKMEQIIQYFDEIRQNLPIINIIFCIILEESSRIEIVNRYLENEPYKSLIEGYNIEVNEISDPKNILRQISFAFLRRLKNKEMDNTYIFNLIPIKLLFAQLEISDICYEYYEPETHDIIIKRQINTDLLNQYLIKIGIDISDKSQNWIRIKNKNLGTFTIYLKNGNVYYFPKVCEKCKEKNCLTYKKAPYFICIEAESGSLGWSNIKGFKQNELLILSKIFALQEGNESNLPKSVLKQIKIINVCKKFN
jgi:hypothetical protein